MLSLCLNNIWELKLFSITTIIRLFSLFGCLKCFNVSACDKFILKSSLTCNSFFFYQECQGWFQIGLETDLKKSQICTIWGQSDPIGANPELPVFDSQWRLSAVAVFSSLRQILVRRLCLMPADSRPSHCVNSSHLWWMTFWQPCWSTDWKPITSQTKSHNIYVVDRETASLVRLVFWKI